MYIYMYIYIYIHVFCHLLQVSYYVNFSGNDKRISFKISKTYQSINAAHCNIIEMLQRHAVSFKL